MIVWNIHFTVSEPAGQGSDQTIHLLREFVGKLQASGHKLVRLDKPDEFDKLERVHRFDEQAAWPIALGAQLNPTQNTEPA
jgi:hypothetical protein